MSAFDNDKTITVSISGRQYPVKVTGREESLVRDVAAEINNGLKEFQLQYAGKDLQDCMSMMLLSKAVELEQLKKSDSNAQAISILDRLTDSIDSVLQ